MPRNGSGTASIPNTFSPSTAISSAAVNANFVDVADMLTKSLATNGESQMTGPLKAADGSAAAPGIAFGADSNTGFRRSASGAIKAVSDGTDVATFSADGLDVIALSIGGAAAAVVPSGGIIMWSGSVASIPSGWYLCDGTNGTPDLRDKFIIGAKQDDSGVAKTNVTGSLTKSGGSKDAIVVSHTHTATVTDPGHDHAGVPVTRGGNGGTGRELAVGDSGNAGTYTPDVSPATTGITVANSTEGSSGTNANLPPYYALAFIMAA